jgi:ABC-2 type transport system ATP-binding protein
VIRIDGLTKRFSGRSLPALDGVNLELRDGEILGLVGLNGAGKTTTLRIAAGVCLPTRGTVQIDGYDVVRDKRRASESVGWVPEVFPFESGERTLPFMVYLSGFHGIPRSAAEPVCRELLTRFGLIGAERERLHTLSLGMKKRFALASALVSDPRNLLLDEILNGLDPEGVAYARLWLTQMRNEGRAILLSSHLLSELQALADRVAFVHQGRVLRTIEIAELARIGDVTLQIAVDRVDHDLVEYLECLGAIRITNSTIFLTGARLDAGMINAELFRRGYVVKELRTYTTSLEDYFLRLVGSEPTG